MIPEKITTLDYEEARFVLLHEIGHSTFRTAVPLITISAEITSCLLVFLVVKDIKSFKKEYLECIFKLGQIDIVIKFLKSYLFILEERRADDFAINNSGLMTLQGGLKYFQNIKAALEKEYADYSISKVFSFNIGWRLIDSSHPTIDSRIEKIKKALKDRFGVDT